MNSLDRADFNSVGPGGSGREHTCVTAANPSWVQEASALPVAFAQVREDPRVDEEVLRRAGPGARVMMVASGGCTAAWLATLPGVASLHLVDPNPAQLGLTRLKLRLLANCDPGERAALLGHAAMEAKERRFRLGAEWRALDLPADVLGPADFVAAVGPDHAGRYERVFAALREQLAPHSQELFLTLRLDDTAAQSARVAPDAPLGIALDRALDDAMAHPNLVRLFGEGATRNPVEPFSRHFARRIRHVMATLPANSNPFLWQMLLGSYPPNVAAPWLSAPVPPRMPAIEYVHATMDDALSRSSGTFDFVHLSNILDWLSPESARTTLERARNALRPGGLVLVRQLNSSLDIPSLGPGFDWLRDDGDAMLAQDRSFFYRAIHAGRRR
jgi:S-adenosylmethionine-diacylglycerol 3-amino-3-carboxypropyl transferase